MFEIKTEEVIKKELLDKIPSDIDKSEGSFIFDAVAPVAIELAQTYVKLDTILKRCFIETSYGEWLDVRASEFGLNRKEGTKATGMVAIKGADGTTIPKWTLVQTEAGLQYSTLDDAVITGGVIEVSIEALEEGSRYNIPPLNIKELPSQIYGVDEVTNNDAITGGSDIETDEAFIERLLFKARMPATSGNKYHYRQWALEVDGIGDARVLALWDGPGTVKVSVIDVDKLPASVELVEATSDYISSVCPIGASVTVEAAVPKYIGVSVTVNLDINYTLDFIIQTFKEKLVEYFKKIAFKQNYVSCAQIGAILLDIPGVMDHTNLMINNTKGNILLEEYEVPVLDRDNISIVAFNLLGGEVN